MNYEIGLHIEITRDRALLWWPKGQEGTPDILKQLLSYALTLNNVAHWDDRCFGEFNASTYLISTDSQEDAVRVIQEELRKLKLHWFAHIGVRDNSEPQPMWRAYHEDRAWHGGTGGTSRYVDFAQFVSEEAFDREESRQAELKRRLEGTGGAS